jgi:very-short-patch-repair endonuclease
VRSRGSRSASHRTRRAFERDRARDARLLLAGYRVLRITWRQLTRERDKVIAMLAALLAERS